MMRKYNLIALTAVALVAAGAAAPAQAQRRDLAPVASGATRLCLLDRAVLLQQSRPARDQAVRVRQQRLQLQAGYDNDRQMLEADIRAFQALKTALQPAAAANRERELDDRRKALADRAAKINKGVSELEGQFTDAVLKAADPVVRTISRERGCSVVMAREAMLVVEDSSLDLTPAVLERLNSMPAPAAGAPAQR